MPPEAVARVLTEATIESLQDLWEVSRGLRRPEQVRTVSVRDALVDPAAVALALPSRLIRQLGLAKTQDRRSRFREKVCQVSMYDPVRLTIQDRSCTVDVLEVPDKEPVLIGMVPLGLLDLVPDVQSGRLVGNPAHGGEPMFELY